MIDNDITLHKKKDKAVYDISALDNYMSKTS